MTRIKPDTRWQSRVKTPFLLQENEWSILQENGWRILLEEDINNKWTIRIKPESIWE